MVKAKKSQYSTAPSGARACVLVAVEIDGARYEPYAVVDLSPEQLKLYVDIGAVDSHPDSVAYAESLDG